MDCLEIDRDSYVTFTLRTPIADERLRRLCHRLDTASTSTELIAAVRAIARTRHPQAVEILGAVLDSDGVVGAAIVKALVGFGAAAAPEMRRIVRESLDADALAQANKVLRIVRCRARPTSPRRKNVLRRTISASAFSSRMPLSLSGGGCFDAPRPEAAIVTSLPSMLGSSVLPPPTEGRLP
jgi:hypothetical protein